MIKSAKEIRATAVVALKGKWGSAVLTTLVLFVIAYAASAILEFIPRVNIVAVIVTVILTSDFDKVAFLTMLRTGEQVRVDCVFDLFKESRLWVTILLMYVYKSLWALLFIIPGIIKGYAYAMTPFILNDNPDLRANEAIELSMAMMNGHKWDLFCLKLSFIGWVLLCIFTFGIGYLWLIPYRYTSYAVFYEDVKAEFGSRAIAQ